MVPAVAWSSMFVAPERRISRQDAIDGVECVGVRSRPDLEDSESRRGVRHEDRHESISLPSAEIRDPIGEIDNVGRGAGIDCQDFCDHPPIVPEPFNAKEGSPSKPGTALFGWVSISCSEEAGLRRSRG